MATPGVLRLTLAAALSISWAPAGVQSQSSDPFGGRGAGGFGGVGFGGGAGYNPPPPNCKAYSCGKGKKPVGKLDNKLWSYGCKDSGMSFMNTAGFDPNNPMKGLQQKSVDKCCVERDICKQTCGMSSRACHDNFQKCSKKVCKGDQNCDMQAMLSELMSEPADDSSSADKKYETAEETRCRGYNKGQKESCQCVAEDEWQPQTNSKLKAFYGKFNPEKLDSDGEIKDLDGVWKKWKGKESEMFMALATKYKEKAVEIRQKPKPPPYEPPPKEDRPEMRDGATEEHAPEAEAEDVREPKQNTDPEAEAFEKKRRVLQQRKKDAAEDENYDLAQTLKEEIQGVTKKEVERLNSLKKEAIGNEDYQAAKTLKKQIDKLEL